jgi:hypothetical protein
MYGKHTDLSDDRASAGAKRGKVGMLLRWHESGSGTKRTCRGRLTISAPEGKTDVPREPGHFRF